MNHLAVSDVRQDTLDEAIAFINQNPNGNGKQAIQFWTQTKTVTARWFEPDNLSKEVNTTISM
ncbi:hypothetical protein [Marinobacter sp.]|uniref:hypothetical protein n=1 Tax=Marinobacter sp. TaxID=50741 RepID=UPI0034A39525